MFNYHSKELYNYCQKNNWDMNEINNLAQKLNKPFIKVVLDAVKLGNLELSLEESLKIVEDAKEYKKKLDKEEKQQEEAKKQKKAEKKERIKKINNDAYFAFQTLSISMFLHQIIRKNINLDFIEYKIEQEKDLQMKKIYEKKLKRVRKVLPLEQAYCEECYRLYKKAMNYQGLLQICEENNISYNELITHAELHNGKQLRISDNTKEKIKERKRVITKSNNKEI